MTKQLKKNIYIYIQGLIPGNTIYPLVLEAIDIEAISI